MEWGHKLLPENHVLTKTQVFPDLPGAQSAGLKKIQGALGSIPFLLSRLAQ